MTGSLAPGVCVVGPLLGVNPGLPISQGELLASRLVDEGFSVLQTSHEPRRWRRLADTITFLFAHRASYDVAVVMVFSGWSYWLSQLGILQAKLLGKTVVAWLHGGNLPIFLARRRWRRRWLARADWVVAPSPYLLEAIAPAKTARTRVIPNTLPVEPAEFRERRSVMPHILWMRTVTGIYRPGLAVKTVAELNRRGVAARLTLAGHDEGLGDQLLDLAQALNVSTHVRFAGFLDAKKKRAEFESHDIFLNTSQVDNAPVALLEAAAWGLPIVTTAVGGIPFLFEDEENALLVGEAGPEALATAVERLLDDEELASRLSVNGRILADESRWTAIRSKWLELFSLIRTAGAPR